MRRLPKGADILDRFHQKIEPLPTTGCWLWKGHLTNRGYGQFQGRDKKLHLAHRFSYSEFLGSLGAKDIVMHICDTPSCVNPDHLRKGTHLENMQDMSLKGRGVGNIKTKGSDVHLSKLSENDVLNIRAMFATGNFTHKQIADKYGLTKENIGCIVRRQTWKHI